MKRLIFMILMLACSTTSLMAKTLLYQTNLNLEVDEQGEFSRLKVPVEPSISVIDCDTRTVIQNIGVDIVNFPYQVAFSPDLTRLYCTERSAALNQLKILDRISGKLIKGISVPNVTLTDYAHGIAVTKTGEIWFAQTIDHKGNLVIVDPIKLEIDQIIPVQTPIHNIMLTPDGKYLVAGGYNSVKGGGSIPTLLHVYDVKERREIWNINLNGSTKGASIRTFAITHKEDGSTDRIFTTIGPVRPTANQNWFPGFVVIDFEKRKEIARVVYPMEFDRTVWKNPVFAGEFYHGLHVTKNQKYLIGNSTPANSVFIYSLPDLQYVGRVPLSTGVVDSLPVGALPDWIASTPDSRFAYVSDTFLKSVDVIDIDALKVVANIKVGDFPASNTLLVVPEKK